MEQKQSEKKKRGTRYALVASVLLLLPCVGCATPLPTATPDAVATQVAQALAVGATLTALVPAVTNTPLSTDTLTPTDTLELSMTPRLTETVTMTATSTKAAEPSMTPSPTWTATLTATLRLPTATPTSTASPLQPADARASAYVGGNASPDLPDGEAGRLSVVATGKYRVSRFSDSTTIPLVVRNNTTKPVVRVSVLAAAYSTDGQLFAIGSDQGFGPKYVAPGEITMGYIYFSDAKLPQDARVEYEITARAIDSMENIGDLEVVDCNRVENRIMGVLKNAYNSAVHGPIEVCVYCFDENGDLLDYYSDYTDKDQTEAGDSILFQVEMGKDACPVYLVFGAGYAY